MITGHYWVIIDKGSKWDVLWFEEETETFYTNFGSQSFRKDEIYLIGDFIYTPS